MKKVVKIIILAVGCSVMMVLIMNPAYGAGWIMNQNHAPLGDYYHLNPRMREIIEEILYSRLYTSEEQLARRIYDWVVENIDYDDCSGVSTAVRVFEEKKGKCGGQARLFIALARDLDLDAKYVLVDRDCYGKQVKHACAWIRLDGRGCLIDPAYQLFDAQHQSWRQSPDRPGRFLLAPSANQPPSLP